ncbi:family 1 glycosylhydrolase [Myxococcota bacterium]|nr:family 1 glycosylhydrolase [Myxococcota bacterium]
MRPLPKGFLLGCATSAYQIEGGIENDWSRWEAAGRLKDPNVRCGRAVDHWSRWREDFALLSAVGAGAYRLSIEWARVEPEPGRFDDAALHQYREMIDALVAAGIEPFVSLLHFTHPTWFHDECPWHEPSGEAVRRFGRFVDRVARALGDRVRYYTVLNEPVVWLVGAYLGGVIPPGRKSVRELVRAFVALVRAHATAHGILKRASGGAAQVGVAHNVFAFAPDRDHAADRFATDYVARLYNDAFPSALVDGRVRLGMIPGVRVDEAVPEAKDTLDFLGVNYYARVFVRAGLPFGQRPVDAFYEGRGPHGVSDLGWEIHPEGLTELLVQLGRLGRPLFVTENGLDDRDDSRRARFLHDHVGAVLDAVDRGADVRGYLFWSLVDNFEWLEGFDPSFGLYHVDRATLARRPTSAAALFERISAARALPDARPDARIKPGGRVSLVPSTSRG